MSQKLVYHLSNIILMDKLLEDKSSSRSFDKSNIYNIELCAKQ